MVLLGWIILFVVAIGSFVLVFAVLICFRVYAVVAGLGLFLLCCRYLVGLLLLFS